MYASKRSVRKAQGIEKGKAPKHNNRQVTEGRGHRIQVIKDEHGFIKKQIIHYSPRRLKLLQKYNELQKKYQEAVEAEMERRKAEGGAPVDESAKG